MKEDQSDQNSIFSNCDTTPQFEKFLDQLGQKIKINGKKK